MVAVSSNEYDRLLAGIRGLDTRLQQLETQGSTSDIILLKLEHLADEVQEVRRGVEKINSRVGKVEAGQTHHEVRMTVLETFCQERVKPALEIITDNRVAIAGILAKYGAIGVGAGGGFGVALAVVGKALGWW